MKPAKTITITPFDPLHMVEQTTVSSATTTAGVAYLLAFRVIAPMVVTTVGIVNGATASGNIDIGIYTPDGTRLASTGSTAQSGTSTIQNIALTAPVTLGRGWYYVAYQIDNTTGTFLSANSASTLWRVTGNRVVANTFPLPATLTMTPSVANYRWGKPVIYGDVL
jgi:hypothetical protein